MRLSRCNWHGGGLGSTPMGLKSLISRRSKAALRGVLLLGLSCATAIAAQNAGQSSDSSERQPASQEPPLTVRSNVVLVPVLVKTKGGEAVFSLTADEFILTDNGVRQSLRLEQDTDVEPLALVVIVETGRQGAVHLDDYQNLGAVLDAVIGDVPHRVAVIGFDSKTRLERDFTPDTDAAVQTIGMLSKGDSGAAILDALAFGIRLLRNQPPAYRHAVLLFSETLDSDSQTTLEAAIRAVDDTNTAIYSFAFSSTKQAVKHEASKLPRPGGSPYSDEPYPPGGCMSKDPNADPDAHGKRDVQALDCASDLLPPLRVARMAFLAARDGFKRNVPESVAKLTGGEYFSFHNAATLKDHLIMISNDMPNYYVLSFRPKSPDPGLHVLELRLKDRPELKVSSRKAYWVDHGANLTTR